MSLGANGTPDKLIKEGLKYTNRIKISFEKNSKDSNSQEITGHVWRTQPSLIWRGILPSIHASQFQVEVLTQLLDTQKDNGPLLFSLMGQCFQGVGLTKWTSIIAKQCPNNADCTKANFDKCIKDYLEAVAGFPNIDNQLICWLCTSKKPALMPMHKFTQCQVQLLGNLEGGYLC
jgi:hypothetical protein